MVLVYLADNREHSLNVSWKFTERIIKFTFQDTSADFETTSCVAAVKHLQQKSDTKIEELQRFLKSKRQSIVESYSRKLLITEDGSSLQDVASTMQGIVGKRKSKKESEKAESNVLENLEPETPLNEERQGSQLKKSRRKTNLQEEELGVVVPVVREESIEEAVPIARVASTNPTSWIYSTTYSQSSPALAVTMSFAMPNTNLPIESIIRGFFNGMRR